jgi:integrase/recombinase XerC
VVDGKGGKDRVVPVVEALCSSLLHYLELRLPLGHRRAVWVGQHSDRLTPRGVREIVRKYSLRMGVKLSPHRLRAQCGVELIRAGASLPEVRAVLGHAGYDTLLPYTALAADEARSALERVARPDRRKGEAHG